MAAAYDLDGGEGWAATAVAGPAEVQVHYRCPSCGGANQLNLQPPPWLVNGVQVDAPTTDLWCHRCQAGATVTVVAV